MTVSLARLNEIVDACETPIRSYPSASAWITSTVYKMLKSEYRLIRSKLATMHPYDARRGDLDKRVRAIKYDLRHRSLEYTLHIN